MPLTASFPDLRNTGTSHKKSQGGVRKPRNKVGLAWAYTAADGGCLPFLTQNALLNPKGKKSFVADTGEVPLTEDKTLGYLRASLRPSVWIWISGQLSRVTASITTRLSTLWRPMKRDLWMWWWWRARPGIGSHRRTCCVNSAISSILSSSSDFLEVPSNLLGSNVSELWNMSLWVYLTISQITP